MKLKNKHHFIILFFSFFLIACQSHKNDFIIENKRAGNLKLNMDVESFKNLFSDYTLNSILNGTNNFEEYYFVRSNNDKQLLILAYFQHNYLAGIKVFDERYRFKNGVQIGTTAQEAIKKGISINTIHFGEDDGLRCEIRDKSGKGKYSVPENIQLIFTRKIYQKGQNRNIEKNAKLKQFIIGKNFDIATDTLTQEERTILKEIKRGYISNNQYTNDYYKFAFTIPNNMEISLWNSQTEDLVNTVNLNSKSRSVSISVFVKLMTGKADGKNLLRIFASDDFIQQFKRINNTWIYRLDMSEIYPDNRKVCFALKSRRNTLYFVSRYTTIDDLESIHEFMNNIVLLSE